MEWIDSDIKVVLAALAVFYGECLVFILGLFNLLWRHRNSRVGMPQILTQHFV